MALVAILTWSGVAAPVTSDVLVLGRELRVRLTGGRDLRLEIKPWPDEDVHALARRIAPSPVHSDLLAATLAEESARTEDGFYSIPLALLGPDTRVLVLRRVFPADRTDGGDWLHVARRSPLPIYDEGLWQVAAWFTGRRALRRFAARQRVGLLSSNKVRSSAFRRAFSTPRSGQGRPPTMGPSCTEATRGQLRRLSAQARRGALLRRRARYTGRTAPEDVESLARSIAARSGVRDLTDIPAGWLVKIPIDVLEPEFLPASDARRKSIEKAKAAMERELSARPPQEATHGLEGVVVIIDPGHGGMDPGTMNHAVWEHDYVFDVASRLRRELEAHTGAKVFLTLDDPGKESVPSRGDALESNRKRSVLTTPPFLRKGVGRGRREPPLVSRELRVPAAGQRPGST